MGIGSGLHWVGVALLFISSVLLLITTISSPVINDIALLRVSIGGGDVGGILSDNPTINFGTFGYCIVNAGGGDGDRCTGSHIGYDPARVVAALDTTNFESFSSGTASALTRVMVLHPIACGVAFLAFLCSCGAGIIGSFAGAIIAALAWILTLVSMAVDFSLFGIIKHHVDDDTSSSAKFGAAIWCLTAAFVTLFLGMFIVFFTCCANRREKRRSRGVSDKEYRGDGYQAPPPQRRKKRFGIF